MSADYVQEYISKVNFKNILQLIDREKLQFLLHGFSYKLAAGITFAYRAEAGSDCGAVIDRIDSGKDSRETFTSLYHPICKLFRNVGNECYNPICEKCDSLRAEYYYTSGDLRPQLYMCHLGLWEMAYPVYISGKLAGVLLAGQIIANVKIGDFVEFMQKEHVISCPEGLGNVKQRDYIKARLECYDIDEEFRAVYEIFDECAVKDEPGSGSKQDKLQKYMCSFEEAERKYKEFCEFSKMFAQLLESYFRNYLKLEEKNLINMLDNELSNKIPYTSREGRLAFVFKIILDFCEATGIPDFKLYIRQEENFIEMLSSKGISAQQESNTIEAALVMKFHKNDLLTCQKGNSHTPDSLRQLGYLADPAYDRFCLYVGDLKGQSEKSIITLLFIFNTGSLQEELLHSFCQMMTLRIGISEAMAQITRERDSFEDKVRRVSHHVKNNAQKALAGVHGVFDNFEIREPQDIQKIFTIDNILRSIKNEMSELKESYAPLCRRFDLAFLLQDLVNEFTPLANDKECTILVRFRQESIFVELNEMEIRIALSNLIENAIKYSYRGHAVEISLEQVAGLCARLEISNFGIGIPARAYKYIRMTGVRGNIKDKEYYNRERTGSGMGLPIAIEYIERLHNGKFNIASYPADDGDREPYHRYVTKVDVELPLKLDKNTKREDGPGAN